MKFENVLYNPHDTYLRVFYSKFTNTSSSHCIGMFHEFILQVDSQTGKNRDVSTCSEDSDNEVNFFDRAIAFRQKSRLVFQTLRLH